MLALGVGVGAAIGPAPSASFAGVSPALLQRLPELLAAIAGSERAGASATAHTSPGSTSGGSGSASEARAAAARRRRRRALRRAAAAGSSAVEAPSGSSAAGGESTTPSAAPKPSPKSSKLPAISSVWLIELDGESFSEAQAQPAASAPYITGTLLHEGTLLRGWNALQGGALASEAALLAPVSAGGSPPLVHQIVQPACPEGAAGATCASAAGQLATADAFAKETLAQITPSRAYREHGLVVVTFATVGIASEQGLPAGAASATLTDKPPAGVLVLSPFAKAGSRASLRFNATSPSQSLQALLG